MEQRKKKGHIDHKYIDVDFGKLDSPYFLNKQIWNRFCRGILKIDIHFNSDVVSYPNICIPIAGIIDYYRKLGVEFTITDINDRDGYVTKTHFWNPYIVEQTSKSELCYPFDKVWKFSTPEGVQSIMDSFIQKIRSSAVVESGILQAITWCINETLDNVLQHANSDCGYIMGQLHKDSHRVVISIFDNGRGILQSFKDSNFTPLPASVTDAITTALQENVTRDRNIGQGNGMWGLAQMVKNNGGTLRVSTGGEGLAFEKDTQDPLKLARCVNMGKDHASTLVDFQLDYNTPISVNDILGNNMTDLWLEDRETPAGIIRYSVIKDCEGTGTRLAAERFRNTIINGFKENKSKIEIDFDGINFVSSSFADELLGKLIAEFGIVDFLMIFVLTNISNQLKMTINRSIEQRFAQKYYDHSISFSDDSGV